MQDTLERDGYVLHYAVDGTGPRIVWVDPALGSSAMRPLQDALDLLVRGFEVVTYDRRGRGRDTPTAEVSIDAEVADLRALLAHVGGAEAVLGFSSGAALVLHAGRGLPSRAAVLLEPAVAADPDSNGLRESIEAALAQGDPEGAVRAFYEGIGVPDDVVAGVVASDVWPDVVRAAPTLLVDIDITVVDDETLASLDVPAHVVVSSGSPDEIVGMGEHLARRLDAPLWREPGGWHGVEPSALSKRLAAVISLSQGSRA